MQKQSLTTGVRGVRQDKRGKVDRGRTRPQDMPSCATCLRQIAVAAVQGYDGKWRCVACNDAHAIQVLGDAGDAAPNASEETPFVGAKLPDDTKRQARAKALLDKYGLCRKAR